MNSRFLSSLSIAAVSIAIAHADIDVTIPETGGVSTAFRQLARTYQSYYTPLALSSSTPAVITGVRFKLWNGETANWPSSTINFSAFKIVLAKPTAQLDTDGEFLSLAPSFNSYWASSTTVYDAPLSITAGSFPDNGTLSNPWGPIINFSSSYNYTGGSILMAVTHPGYGTSAVQAFFATGDFQNGTADAISTTLGTDPTFGNAPDGFSSPYIVQFITAPVPEPATLSVLAIGAAAMLRRRAKKSSR